MGLICFAFCKSVFFSVSGGSAALEGGQGAEDKESGMKRWRGGVKGEGGRRQVQQTPGAITGALQKLRQEINVALATWR